MQGPAPETSSGAGSWTDSSVPRQPADLALSKPSQWLTAAPTLQQDPAGDQRLSEEHVMRSVAQPTAQSHKRPLWPASPGRRLPQTLSKTLTERTSVSTLSPVCCTSLCQPCRCGLSPAPVGHRDWGRRARSRWTGELGREERVSQLQVRLGLGGPPGPAARVTGWLLGHQQPHWTTLRGTPGAVTGCTLPTRRAAVTSQCPSTLLRGPPSSCRRPSPPFPTTPSWSQPDAPTLVCPTPHPLASGPSPSAT